MESLTDIAQTPAKEFGGKRSSNQNGIPRSAATRRIYSDRLGIQPEACSGCFMELGEKVIKHKTKTTKKARQR